MGEKRGLSSIVPKESLVTSFWLDSEVIGSTIIVVVLCLFLYFAVFWPAEKEKMKVAKEWEANKANRPPYRWQDDVMPNDVPIIVKLANSWWLFSIVIPVMGWALFLILYKVGWFEDGRKAAIQFFYGPLLALTIVTFMGTMANFSLKFFGEINLRGLPYWKACLKVKDINNFWKPFLVASLIRLPIGAFIAGWVLVGVGIYSSILY